MSRRVGIVVLMVLFSLMSYFDRTIMSIAGPVIAKEFSLSETQMGAIYSAFLLSYAILMIPGGQLADRFGPRAVLNLHGFGRCTVYSLNRGCRKSWTGCLFGGRAVFFSYPAGVRHSHFASVSLLRQDECELGAAFRAGPSLGMDRVRRRNWRSYFTNSVFADDRTLWLAHRL